MPFANSQIATSNFVVSRRSSRSSRILILCGLRFPVAHLPSFINCDDLSHCYTEVPVINHHKSSVQHILIFVNIFLIHTRV